MARRFTPYPSANVALLKWILYAVIVYPMALMASAFTVAALLFSVGIVFGNLIGDSDWHVLLPAGLAAATMGLCIGWLQTSFLRQHMRWTADDWTVTTGIGGGVAGLVLGTLLIIFDSRPDLSLSGEQNAYALLLAFVSIIAVFQWWHLRDAVDNAWLWVPINAAGALAFCGVHANFVAPVEDPLIALVSALLAPIAQGLVTGISLIVLFERFSYPVMDPFDPRLAASKVTVDLPPRKPSIWDDAL
jgi:hypothetical protein